MKNWKKIYILLDRTKFLPLSCNQVRDLFSFGDPAGINFLILYPRNILEVLSLVLKLWNQRSTLVFVIYFPEPAQLVPPPPFPGGFNAVFQRISRISLKLNLKFTLLIMGCIRFKLMCLLLKRVRRLYIKYVMPCHDIVNF